MDYHEFTNSKSTVLVKTGVACHWLFWIMLKCSFHVKLYILFQFLWDLPNPVTNLHLHANVNVLLEYLLLAFAELYFARKFPVAII